MSYSTASPTTKTNLVQNINSAKVEKLCSKWRKEGLGHVKGNQSADKKNFCMFLFVWVCSFRLSTKSLSQRNFTLLSLGSTVLGWGLAGLLGSLTILGISWTAGPHIGEEGLKALWRNIFGHVGDPLSFSALWLLEVVQQTLKSYFKMVRPDPQVWQSSCLSQALGFSTFQLKALRMLISGDFQSPEIVPRTRRNVSAWKVKECSQLSFVHLLIKPGLCFFFSFPSSTLFSGHFPACWERIDWAVFQLEWLYYLLNSIYFLNKQFIYVV